MQSVVVNREDGTIDSFQRAPFVGRLEAMELERLYWDEIRRATFGAMRFSRGAIRVGGVWPVVLRFDPLVDGRRGIAGGLVVRRAGGTIGWHTDGKEVSVDVEGFAPRLRGPLWRLEVWIHAAVGRRFLRRLAREAG